MGPTNAEQEIRAVLDRWAQASCAKDLDGIMACYAPDVRAFYAIASLQFKGVQDYREHWKYCLGLAPGDMVFKIHDLDITASEDIAFGHFLAICGGTDENGKEQTGWIRGTVCLRQTDGLWRIVHEHYSMPFDVRTMKALDKAEP